MQHPQGLDARAGQQLAAAGQALDAGRVDEAERHLAGVLAGHPTHPEALRMQAGILSMRGRHPQAVASMQRALAQRPDNALYHNTLGTLLGAAGDYDSAVAALRRSCELNPQLPLAWYNLGVMLTRSVRNDEAIVALRRAVQLTPSHAAARALLADLLRVQGHHEEAEAEYRRILREQRWAGMAWWGLADLKDHRLDADDIERMHAALKHPQASDDDRIAIGFALARAYDDLDRKRECLAALEQANALARRRQRWNAAAFSAGVRAGIAAFEPPPAPAPEPALGEEVVFIVGLPRSGSTLVEQILASHPAVAGAGELPDLPQVLTEESRRREQPFPRWVASATPADWERLGRRYLSRTAHWRRDRPIFTDKLPSNWIYIGAIRAMLPGARIICCQRDPLETAFSCYRQRLENNEYTRTFEDLAAFWRDYRHAVGYWQQRSPERVMEHDYEALIADPEARIRALLEFCGLPFDAACLAFHENRRDVRSPSATQVRQPLRADTARAATYGALLDPLRRALGLGPA